MTPSTLEQAVRAHHAGDHAAAEAGYRAVLVEDPAHAVAGYNLGILLLAHGRLDGLALARAALARDDPSLDRAAAASSVARALLEHQYRAHAEAFLHGLRELGVQAADHAALEQRCGLPPHLARWAPVMADGSATAPPDGAPSPAAGGASLERYHPIESSRYVFAIDIVGGCNLRCPTCPVGQGAGLPKGLMDFALFERVLAKIVRESAPHRPDVWLFSWGEPLMHPQVGHFIQAVRDAGLTSLLSSNLHHTERIDAVMQANPDRMKVSLSSLRQEIYAQTHVRGDIARVIDNLHELARARDRHRATTEIWIGHHLYRNTIAEQAGVQALAHSLGFGYAPSTAIVAPIETALALASEDSAAPAATPAPLADQLFVHPREIAQRMAARRSGRYDCELRFNMTTIDHRGHVGLCCGTTQPLDAAAPMPFLDHSSAELEQQKYRHDFCRRCMGAQLHLTTADR